MAESKQIRIETKKLGSTLWVATSPDVPGLHVAEESVGALRRELPKVVEALFQAMGFNARVSPPDAQDPISRLTVVLN